MTFRSIKVAAGFSTFAAVLAVGIGLPERQASAQVQAVPREGVSFNDTVTARVTVETVDTDTRTVAVTLPTGRTVLMPVSNSVTPPMSLRSLEAIMTAITRGTRRRARTCEAPVAGEAAKRFLSIERAAVRNNPLG